MHNYALALNLSIELSLFKGNASIIGASARMQQQDFAIVFVVCMK